MGVMLGGWILGRVGYWGVASPTTPAESATPNLTNPPTTVDDVIGRLRDIDARLSPDDGVAVFNRMYLTVTEHVSALIAPAGARPARARPAGPRGPRRPLRELVACGGRG